MANGVSQKIQHIKTPIIIWEGLHRVCEVPQQVCDAMKIFEKSYIRVAKASRFLMFVVRSGVPE